LKSVSKWLPQSTIDAANNKAACLPARAFPLLANGLSKCYLPALPMPKEIVFIAGKDPLTHMGGHSNYVRTNAAGFDVHFFRRKNYAPDNCFHTRQ
jgi:hypothetical protein